jgi:O-antigen/teichoic acid export membrane protein
MMALGKGLLIGRASWTVADQVVVSLGNFLVNVQLARGLTLGEYGMFAILLGGFMALQIVNSSLVFYPFTVRFATAPVGQRATLLSTTLLLQVMTSLQLGTLLVAGLLAFGHSDLVLPAVAYFLLWQTQEATRRGLLADFRFRTATIGDAVTYIGQPALIAILANLGSLTLASGLYAMAVACALGALINASQLALSRPLLDCRRLIEDYWSIGRWCLLDSYLLHFNVQIFPWSLAAVGGAAAAAPFQAILNVAHLLNPVIYGLGNVIPQSAARALKGGKGSFGAWREARVYILIGFAPTVAYCAVALLAPDILLRVLYGANSPYLALTVPVQLFALAWPMRYAGELICAFFYGVEVGRLAVLSNIAAIVTAIIALPLVIPFGLAGICLALVSASILRVAVAYYALTTIIRTDESRPANRQVLVEGEA